MFEMHIILFVSLKSFEILKNTFFERYGMFYLHIYFKVKKR